MLRNDLSALDTRVTNAITGGNLAAPFEYDVKNSSYTDDLNNVGYEDYGYSSLTINQMKVGGGAYETSPGVPEGKIKVFPIIGTRIYSAVFDIKANYELRANISVTTDYGESTGYVLIMLLDAASGATLYQRQVDLGSAINESIPLSAFNGKKARVSLKTVKVTSRQTSFVVNCNINSLIISNK